MGRNAFLSYAFDAANYAGYGGVLVWQVSTGTHGLFV